MNLKSLKLSWLVLGLTSAIAPSAWACVAKSGKLCPSTVANQVDRQVKLGKPLPTGDVGDVTPVGGVVSLGAVAAQPAPSTAGPTVQDSPDGWFYLPHSADLTRNPSGLGSRPITYAWMLMIQARAAQLPGYKGPNVNPDGSLTPRGVQQGWVRLQAVNIPQQVVQAVPPALQVVAPTLAPTPGGTPGLAAPALIPTPVNTPGLVAPGLVPTAQAALVPPTTGSPDGWFYLSPAWDTALYPSGLNKKPISYATLLQIQSVAVQHGGYAGPTVNPDGSLTQLGLNKGWVRLQPVNVPQQIAQTVPVPLQVKAPVLAPTPGGTPGLAAPGLVPTPVNAPGLAGQGPVPTAGQITAPQPTPGQVNVPGYAAPGKAPTALNPVAPKLLAGHAANGAAHAHETQLVEVYHPTMASMHRYDEAHLTGDSGYHLVIIGFKELY
ncbi:hypothetical protein [Rhodoferax sp.]|uniref:hypothetical protein n=1 Tax=Rhodoferax sp. TaxID=50421 RepID=UPI0025FAE94E|nr:hypothetical protein [Rhodoferax sp.]